MAGAEDTFSATTEAEYGAAFRRQNAARPDLLLFGDATLMFADATTNTIAEAVRTTWGIDKGPQAWGYEQLMKKLRRGEGEGRSPGYGLTDRFRGHASGRAARRVEAAAADRSTSGTHCSAVAELSPADPRLRCVRELGQIIGILDPASVGTRERAGC